MKAKFALVIFIAQSLPLAVKSQTAEEIIKNYAQALGGAEAWRKLQSMSMQGRVVMQGMEMPTTIRIRRPSFFYQEISFMGKNIIQATDGSSGWYVNPFMGNEKPQLMKPEEVEELKKGGQMDDELMFYKEKNGKISLEGEEIVEGIPCYVVSLSFEADKTSKYFIDKELWLPVKQVSQKKSEDAVEQWFYDYRSVDGKWVPFRMVQKMKGEILSEILVQKVEFDSVPDEKIFKMP